MRRVALVGCGRAKRRTPALAKDLYTGGLFKATRRWAEANTDSWLILSAKHGLLEPGQVVAPYNLFLGMLTKAEQRIWGGRVRAQLAAVLQPGDEVVFLAGQLYRQVLGGITYPVEEPLAGLGIGQRLHWLTQHQRRSA